MTRCLAGRVPGIPLSDVGVQQAQALAARLARIDRLVSSLVSSPIQRAFETAEILAASGGRVPETNDAFTEFDFGKWTGKSFAELKDDPMWHTFNESRHTTRAPGGESMQEVQDRALAGLRQILRTSSNSTVAVISHADVIRAITLGVTGTPIGNFWRFQIGAASISELICGPEGDERLVRLNDCAHLEHLAS